MMRQRETPRGVIKILESSVARIRTPRFQTASFDAANETGSTIYVNQIILVEAIG
jgi:hypothetical protein